MGVALGVAVLLGAVMAASYSFTTDGSRPDPGAQFGSASLAVNGSCWRVPLIGGMLDKAFYAPSTLSVQKLGVLYEAHPEVTLPEWATPMPPCASPPTAWGTPPILTARWRSMRASSIRPTGNTRLS